MSTTYKLTIAIALTRLILVDAYAQDVALPAMERVVLDNGTVLILNEKHDVPIIGLRAIVMGGAVADPPGKYGLASLFASLIEKGAGTRSSAEFAEAVDSVGGRFSARAGLERIDISAEFMSRDTDLMIELLADVLLRPKLERDEFDKLRERMINFIRAAKDSDPGALMPIYGDAFLFGEHPYGNPVGGSEDSIASITHRDVLKFYDDQAGGNRLIIAVSGDFVTADVREKFRSAFAGWRPAKTEMADVSTVTPQSGRRILLIDKPGATQTYFWIGNVGVAMNFPERADLDLANTVFGGRFTSLLNTALRIESGLTYGARSRLLRPSKAGSVAISSYTRTDATNEAIDMALGVLEQFTAAGIDEVMIESARNYVLGQFPTRLETASQLAVQFAVIEAHGLGGGYIDSYAAELAGVTVASAAAVIGDVYPSQDNLVFVLLGDAASIRDSIQKYGTVTEASITEPLFRLPAE